LKEIKEESINDHPVQHARSDITIEFKRIETDDPCKPYDNKRCQDDKELSVGAQQGFSQLAGYVALLDQCQYRTHIFQVLMCGKYTRFLRWDHSSCLFTQRFDYTTTEGSIRLMEFFHRFSQLSRADRGYDDRFTLAKFKTQAEEDEIDEQLKSWNVHDEKGIPMMRFTVVNKDHKKHELFTRRHVKRRDSAIGRSARTFPVWNATTRKVNFYKELWSPAEQEKSEADIMKDLNNRDVPNVPHVMSDGKTSTTQNHKFVGAAWNNCRAHSSEVVSRTLNFVLMEEAGRPLYSFRSAYELLKVTYDAFLGWCLSSTILSPCS
jgi:hypothetical protein